MLAIQAYIFFGPPPSSDKAAAATALAAYAFSRSIRLLEGRPEAVRWTIRQVMMRDGGISLFIFAGPLLALLAAHAAAAQGEAKGELAVGGKTTPLAHAYAVPQRGGETLLILTDEPLSDKSIQDVFERIHLADDGKLHAVEMILDSKKIPISVSIRHNSFRAHGGGYSSAEHFEPRASEPGTVAGRIYRTEPGEFVGVAYTFDATFTAPFWREPAPTLGGAAAAGSPQAKVAVAFFKAGRAGNVAGVKKCVVSEQGQRTSTGPAGRSSWRFSSSPRIRPGRRSLAWTSRGTTRRSPSRRNRRARRRRAR